MKEKSASRTSPSSVLMLRTCGSSRPRASCRNCVTNSMSRIDPAPDFTSLAAMPLEVGFDSRLEIANALADLFDGRTKQQRLDPLEERLPQLRVAGDDPRFEQGLLLPEHAVRFQI